MTNEELDKARAEKAFEQSKGGDLFTDIAAHAARLAREGWTPPVPVDPDLAEAEDLANEYGDKFDNPFLDNWFLKAIKRGRELERAEAKPTFFDALTANSALCRAEEMIRFVRCTLEIITQPEDAA